MLSLLYILLCIFLQKTILGIGVSCKRTIFLKKYKAKS